MASPPEPPSDSELYSYLGPQRRWFIVVRTVAVGFACVSLARFATQRIPLLPFELVLEMLVVSAAVNLYTSTRRRRVGPADHRGRVAGWHPDRHPSVDVFLPSAGEPLTLLASCYRHVAALDYPGDVTVHVLDDSARPAVRRLAELVGFQYLSRPNRGELKKAGNLRYGYERSDGDLIVVFDADFAPRRDFLAHLVPYLDDPAVGIVQSPQFFDTTAEQNWLQRAAGTTQELFYRWVQPSRDAVGAPICVGTNAVYRRAALDRTGGFAPVSHSEDVHTGVSLIRAGFEVRYVPVVLAKGLCPDGLDSYLGQQYRWCVGSMSLLVDRDFHRIPLTLAQRLCFFSGFGYYLSTAVFALLMPAPALVMAWFLPGYVRPSNYLWLVPLFALHPLTTAVYKTRWGRHALRAQVVYSYCHVVAAWHTLRRHTADWVPTGASVPGRSVATTIRRLMSGWIVGTQAVFWTGIGTSLARGYRWQDFSVMILLGALNLAVLGPILTLGHPRLAAVVRGIGSLGAPVGLGRTGRPAASLGSAGGQLEFGWLDEGDEIEVASR